MSPTNTDVTAAELKPCGRSDHPSCGIRDVLDRLGDKWSVLVIVELVGGPRRFREIQRAIDGISQRMLRALFMWVFVIGFVVVRVG